MSNPSRRMWIKAGVSAAVGLSGVAAAAAIANRYGLVPPGKNILYTPGDTLTYASQRLLTRHSLAREFPRAQISQPFANTNPPNDPEYRRLQTGAFAGWKLTIKGLVARPASLSLGELKTFPARSQVTQLICEEGWSFIAEWTGVPLSHILERAGILPNARYVVFFSLEPGRVGSTDMADALHPQTLLTYGMNGAELTPPHGGPLRIRVPRQLGYKSLKFLNRMLVTDNLGRFTPTSDYSW